MEKGIENLQERAEKCTPTFFTELWNWIFTVYYTQLTIACGSNHSVQISSVTLSCPTLCNPIYCSTPGLPVHYQLPEFTQIHVHQVSDAIQPSHPLLSPSPPASNPSQHQSLFQWVNSSHEVAKVLEFQLKHHFFQRNPRVDLLQNGLVGSPCSQKHQFFSAQPSSQSNSHIHTWLLEKP